MTGTREALDKVVRDWHESERNHRHAHLKGVCDGDATDCRRHLDNACADLAAIMSSEYGVDLRDDATRRVVLLTMHAVLTAEDEGYAATIMFRAAAEREDTARMAAPRR